MECLNQEEFLLPSFGDHCSSKPSEFSLADFANFDSDVIPPFTFDDNSSTDAGYQISVNLAVEDQQYGLPNGEQHFPSQQSSSLFYSSYSSPVPVPDLQQHMRPLSIKAEPVDVTPTAEKSRARRQSYAQKRKADADSKPSSPSVSMPFVSENTPKRRGKKPKPSSPTSSNTSDEPVLVDSENDKKMKKVLRNRISAQQSRDRRKAYIEELEGKLAEAALENQTLTAKVSCLMQENGMLRLELDRQRRSDSMSSSPSSNSSPSSPDLSFPVVPPYPAHQTTYIDTPRMPFFNGGFKTTGVALACLFTFVMFVGFISPQDRATIADAQPSAYIGRVLHSLPDDSKGLIVKNDFLTRHPQATYMNRRLRRLKSESERNEDLDRTLQRRVERTRKWLEDNTAMSRKARKASPVVIPVPLSSATEQTALPISTPSKDTELVPSAVVQTPAEANAP
eukprot:GILK01001378.1.p1 GENE.GILK01001378.1~~GILK01001378.1.p1  ORF type:complete len:451 (+),score=42.81 GILK01001378.1:1208-2560(+)